MLLYLQRDSSAMALLCFVRNTHGVDCLAALGWMLVLSLALSWVLIQPSSQSPSNFPNMPSQISKKNAKFIADGVSRAELNEFFTRELSEEGYSGCDADPRPHAHTDPDGGPYSLPHSMDNRLNYCLQIIVHVTHTQEVLGEKGRHLRELTALVQK
jgi:hypothetical protein